jgi:hypothetical protein
MPTPHGVWGSTVKRVDEVVRHPHLVTQDQFTQVSKKVSEIPAEDFTINIELFLQTFTNVELVRQNWIISKVTSPQIYFPMLYHCAKLSSLFKSCAADFSLLNLPKGKSLGRSKPATNS